MKRTVQLLLFFAIAASLMTYSGCKGGGDNPTPPTDIQIDKLSKTWKVSSVTLDGTAQTPAYADFKITFNGTHGSTTINYTTTGRPAKSAWDDAGTFTFNTTNPQTQMTRNEDAPPVAFNYTVADAQLQLSFTYNGTGFDARTEEVKGAWTFVLIPQ